MATVKELIEFTGVEFGDLVKIDENENALTASQKMRDNNIGLLIIEEDGNFSGVLSERDLVHKVTCKELKPENIRVKIIYTSKVITCNENDNINTPLMLMKEHQIRHIPVTDEAGIVISVVSERDITALLHNNINAYEDEEEVDL